MPSWRRLQNHGVLFTSGGGIVVWYSGRDVDDGDASESLSHSVCIKKPFISPLVLFIQQYPYLLYCPGHKRRLKSPLIIRNCLYIYTADTDRHLANQLRSHYRIINSRRLLPSPTTTLNHLNFSNKLITFPNSHIVVALNWINCISRVKSYWMLRKIGLDCENCVVKHVWFWRRDWPLRFSQ